MDKTKDGLRAYARSVRESLGQEEIRRRSAVIGRLIASSDGYAEAAEILCYAPLEGEIDLLGLMEQALAEGKRLFLPKVLDRQGRMAFGPVDFLRDLVPGPFGLLEPEHAEENCFSASALAVVPALVIGRDLYRIGYGKGYYDRFLRTFEGRTVGVVLKQCLLDSVPHGETDVRLDGALTEEGWI